MNNIGYIYDPIFLKHNLPDHPENARRLEVILDYFDKNNLIERLTKIEVRDANEDELLLCHDKSLIEKVKNACGSGITNLDADTYINCFSYNAAISAVGGMIELVNKITEGSISKGIVLSRPPGHHATESRSMGFCLFNTIAIGARYATRKNNLKKVAIVDIDVHHGNGTQSIFYDDPSVMYISTHQYPHYPGTGTLRETGDGKATGTNINIPFPAYVDDDGYKDVFNHFAIPILERFKPELIFVSVGFDGHETDPLSSINLSLTGYDWLCRSLINAAEKICEGKIIFSLEGGYNLNVLAPGFGNIVRGLSEDEMCDDPFTSYNYSTADVSKLIEKLKEVHNL